MKKLFLLVTIMLAFLLMSCGTKPETNNLGGELDDVEVVDTAFQHSEGDFIYRIWTDKEEYYKNEAVKIYAELEYIGDKEEVTIFHAASPFYFPMTEKTRGFEIGYPMNEPLISTTLKKGQPLREEYQRSGGYGSEEPEEFINFMKSFLEEGFPVGYYAVNGYVNFYVESDEGSQNDYKLEGKIDFKVVESN